MSSLVSQPKIKFLLDENVHKKLGVFLKMEKYDAAYCLKGVSDSKLAALSKSEERVLVTNDSDFRNPALVPRNSVLSVVLLKLPQNEVESLLKAFSMLLAKKKKPEDFEGKLFVLKEDGFEASEIKES